MEFNPAAPSEMKALAEPVTSPKWTGNNYIFGTLSMVMGFAVCFYNRKYWQYISYCAGANGGILLTIPMQFVIMKDQEWTQWSIMLWIMIPSVVSVIFS
jgi:hypothetical protein